LKEVYTTDQIANADNARNKDRLNDLPVKLNNRDLLDDENAIIEQAALESQVIQEYNHSVDIN